MLVNLGDLKELMSMIRFFQVAISHQAVLAGHPVLAGFECRV